MFETYFFLFIDSLVASLVLPIRSEMVFFAMTIFDNYDKYLVFAVAFVASVLGLIINWWLGKYLAFVKKSKAFSDKEKELTKIENFWNKYAIWLLPIAVFNSMGAVMCLFCGFFKTKFWHLLPLIAAGRLIYYCCNIFIQ